ncbi:hypothetical protein BOX15_Mlig033656g4 [Macrostomum lignano]|uniref:DH domain-containing protein n=1 Tax=Macrostomum lignano TaxID=282301 RepID=A0A267DGH7_9PLAT|nr:hypothetical protein BOX15_Mlig033656g4 [Macrostomum lignano]
MDEFEEACDLDGDALDLPESALTSSTEDCLFVVVGSHLQSNERLMANVNSFRQPIEFAESIEAHLSSQSPKPMISNYNRLIYITDQFDFNRHCALFKRLTAPSASLGTKSSKSPSYCVLGPPALAQLLLLHRSGESVSIDWPRRPVYSCGMRGVVACLTGFSEKARVSRIAFLVHCLGGGIRAEVSRKVTHLIAVSTADAKYRKAVTYGIPVMTADWVEAAWMARDSAAEHSTGVASATTGELFAQHRLRPFVGNTLAFFGYSDSDTSEMAQLAREAGGTVVPFASLTASSSSASSTNPAVTQIVVNDLLDFRSIPALPTASQSASTAVIVRSEWFWLAIQNGFQFAASLYALKQQCLESSASAAAAATAGLSSSASASSATGAAAARKRRRLAPQQPLESLAGPPDPSDLMLLSLPSPAAGATSSALHRLSGVSSAASLLDATADSSALSPVAERHHAGASQCGIDSVSSPAGQSQQNQQQQQQPVDSRQQRRLQKAMELAHTEANYVSILGVIVNVIRREVADASRPGGALLPDMAVEIIFHGLEPIYKLHRDIEAALRRLTENWSDTCQVGKVFTDRADQLSQVYPPFVNFVEQAKEEMARWEQRDPRFRAYLRLCLSRKECLRQSLKELLIRPVQRLPSVTLLLGDMLKVTNEDSPDHAGLQQALAVVRKALDHINEEKRTTDSQLAMFDIINDIENCPPSLLSSHRVIIDRVDAIELANGSSGYRPLAGAGSFLSLLLFNDHLQISKQRKNGASSSAAASASAAAGGSHTGKPSSSALKPPKRQYRHLELLHLSRVRRVCSLTDDRDPSDIRRLFAFVCRSAESGELFVLSFALIGSADKPAFLRSVCAQICAATCSAESVDSYFARVDVDELRVETNGVFDRQHQLSAKARRFGKRVTRALSNRTPRRTLTRAVSAALQQQHSVSNSQQASGHDSSVLGDSPCPDSPARAPGFDEEHQHHTSFAGADTGAAAVAKTPKQQQDSVFLSPLPPPPLAATPQRQPLAARKSRTAGLGASLRRGLSGLRQSFRLAGRPSAAAAAAARRTAAASAAGSATCGKPQHRVSSLADWTLRPELCCSNTSLASLDSCQSLPVASTTAARSAAATASSMSSATNAFGAPSGRANPATLLLTAQAAREDLPKSSSSSRLSIAGLSAKRLRKQLSSWSLSRGK